MPTLIQTSTRIPAAGNMPKTIDEFIGRVNSHTQAVSIARMKSPQGWAEPGQKPDFDEFTLVLSGMLRVTSKLGPSTFRPVRRSSPIAANGSNTVRRSRRERSTSQSASPLLPSMRLIGMQLECADNPGERESAFSH